uniref:ShKT domain-containing protein n=1 Tax=Trichuris muris TaxID=70415 RepID=A0A5S6QAR0_TRIMR
MTKNKILSKLFLVNIAILVSYCTFGEKEKNNRYTLIRAVPKSSSQLQYLHSLMSNAHSGEVDFWRFSGTLNKSCDLMVDVSTLKNLSEQFKHTNIDYTIIIHDVGNLILSQEKRKARRRPVSPYYVEQVPGYYFNLAAYHSYGEISNFIDWAEMMFPNLAKSHIIGYTHEKRPIRLLQIGLSDYPKPAIWLDAGIHAREWIAPSTALIIITELLTNYESDPSVKAYVDQLTWYILPVVNPDGLEFSRASSDPRVRLWRKNRSAATCTSSIRDCCFGVDLNRNFDFKWGEIGGSNNPCDEIYQGSGPFSEPETDAIRRFITNRNGEFAAFLTLHSYSQIWMYPFGHKRQVYSSDVRQLRDTALRASRALYSVYKTRYEVGTGADLLYPASGGSDDWAKAVAGIKYSYLLELRPHRDSWQGFLLDESHILPTGKETWEGIKVVADEVLSATSRTVYTSALTASTLPWCQDEDPFLCRWWAINGGCHVGSVIALRCPVSCGIC